MQILTTCVQSIQAETIQSQQGADDGEFKVLLTCIGQYFTCLCLRQINWEPHGDDYFHHCLYLKLFSDREQEKVTV